MPQFTSSGQRRGLAANSTQASFTLTAKRWAGVVSSGKITLNDGTNTHTLILMDRFRGVTLGFGGVGSNNQTANYRVWLARIGIGSNKRFPFPALIDDFVDIDVIPYIADTSTITLSAATGISAGTGIYTASELIADTLTATLATTATTPKGIGSQLETSRTLGTAGVYSPGDNTPAKLMIPDMGGAHAFIVEFDMTGATSMNFDYELTL